MLHFYMLHFFLSSHTRYFCSTPGSYVFIQCFFSLILFIIHLSRCVLMYIFFSLFT